MNDIMRYVKPIRENNEIKSTDMERTDAFPHTFFMLHKNFITKLPEIIVRKEFQLSRVIAAFDLFVRR